MKKLMSVGVLINAHVHEVGASFLENRVQENCGETEEVRKSIDTELFLFI